MSKAGTELRGLCACACECLRLGLVAGPSCQGSDDVFAPLAVGQRGALEERETCQAPLPSAVLDAEEALKLDVFEGRAGGEEGLEGAPCPRGAAIEVGDGEGREVGGAEGKEDVDGVVEGEVERVEVWEGEGANGR